MQPPRRRVPHIDLRSTDVLRNVILNGAAIILTLLIVRLASLVVQGSNSTTFARYVRVATEPLVWPLKLIPGLAHEVGRDVLIADLILIPLIFTAGLFAAGILTGWKEASSDTPHVRPPGT